MRPNLEEDTRSNSHLPLARMPRCGCQTISTWMAESSLVMTLSTNRDMSATFA